MRRSLFLYLFVFSLLLAVVIYTNGKRIADSKDQRIKYLEKQLTLAQNVLDSLSSSEGNVRSSFFLINNEEALSYIEERGFDPKDVIEKVESKLINSNKASSDNKFIPYEGMQGYFRINKIELLNHRWILASFSDGFYWGDLFLTYNIDESGNIEISTQEAVLYPRS